MKVIIDRFEGEYAVVEIEDGTFGRISKAILPGAKEGDVVLVEIDHGETQKRRKKIQKLMDEVWND
jgi:D-Tyr-tRNAtyr deacylase